jgi:outer membrane protein TolC
MLKNRHLLGALVLLGAINGLAFIGLMSGERDSARALKDVQREIVAARDEHAQTLEALGKENQELRSGLTEARASIVQMREEMDTVRDRLNRTRKALAVIEERLEKTMPPSLPADSKGHKQ